ncbi:hypothetical protein DS909_17095 [Phaeobacter gallaeciensis]|uniref:Peptidase M10 serralysin C-terminal domain-containing protein n=2 Tax=Roseobacteraceae TaxID=2854170 RepID=A0A366WTG3_9RHOB|nr:MULTISPECIES: calcium-binding protein [Roseobacteraceae]MBT3140043.1 calcium-binding protein [Falsiruegeria litorea]MBT8167237.1 calcium-binding protein [Falsiruegeria litorea]RBW52437.1 hypothetical protein DS909_17095 [Phaeobacter gallaeciensis]
MGKVGWTVRAVNVESGVFSPDYLDTLEQLVLTAARDWGQYLYSDHGVSFEIELNITDLPNATLATAGTSFVNTGNHNGAYQVAQPLTLFELNSGVDLNGASRDIVINFDAQALANAYIEADLTTRSSTVPSYQFDLYSIVLHELAHGLGILSFRDGADKISGLFGTTFDALIDHSSGAAPTFAGTHAQRLNGGNPIQLVAGNASHIDILHGSAESQILNSVSLLSESIRPGQRLHISALELAILQDLGARVQASTSGDDYIVGFNRLEIENVELPDDPEALSASFQSILEGRDDLVGETGNDTLIGLGGNDHILGGRGHDVLIGGAGSDELDGGDGIDVAHYASAPAKVHLDLRLSRGTFGDARGDTFIAIENILGTDFDDYIYGDNAKNKIEGGDGTDRLRGHNGNDTLIGGAGADDLHGGSGRDWADYANASTSVSINLRTGKGLTGEAKGDTFTSIENLTGSVFHDLLIGSKVSNRIIGGAGNDTVVGGVGGDFLDGGSGVDLASYATADTRVNLDLRSGKGSAGEASRDTFVSIENITGSAFNDYVYGDDKNNLIRGGQGDDRLRGHNGMDTLLGGEGHDDLYGGSGADTFVFDTALDAETNVDSIRRYSPGYDRIALDRTIFVELEVGGLQDINFTANATGLAQDLSDRIVFNTTTGALLYDPDGTASLGAIHFATVSTGIDISPLDIWVF